MTDVVDILVNGEIYPTSYQVQFTQETSKSLNGATYVKDLGDPLWNASYVTKPFKASQLNQWRAKFAVMGGSLNLFYAYTTHHYPQAYPNGVGLGDVSNVIIASIGSNRKTIILSGLPSGFKFTFGDYVQLGDSLHYVISISGSSCDVAPPIPSRITIGNKVRIIKPYCTMRIVPNSFKSDADSTGRGTISFDAVEARL